MAREIFDPQTLVGRKLRIGSTYTCAILTYDTSHRTFTLRNLHTRREHTVSRVEMLQYIQDPQLTGKLHIF